VLGINDDPVTIKGIEISIIDRAFAEGWVGPEPPAVRTGKTVAVIGSGPPASRRPSSSAGAGHAVTVFERADRIGGLLRYGIPEFKMEKRVLGRRLAQMEAEGVRFVVNAHSGWTGPSRRCGGSSTPSCSAAGPAPLATCRSRAGTSTGSTSRWTT